MSETATTAGQSYVEALRAKPQSARDLAAALGRGTDRSTVASIRHTLERLERKGLVQRSLPAFQGPWVWEAVPDARRYTAHLGHPAAKWVADQFGPMMASAGHEISHDGAGTLSADGATLDFLRDNPPDADGYVSEIDGQAHIWYGGAPYLLTTGTEAATDA
jgi:hypothetical protein